MRKYIFLVAMVFVLSGCTVTNNKQISIPQNTNQNNINMNNNQNDSELGQSGNIQLPGTEPQPELPTAASYSLADVAKHNQASDCWLVANAKVYNVTTFIPQHPGGDKILQGCGKDMTEFFNTIHLKQSKEKLPEFYIGDLK